VGDDKKPRAYLDLILLQSAAGFKNPGLPIPARPFAEKVGRPPKIRAAAGSQNHRIALPSPVRLRGALLATPAPVIIPHRKDSRWPKDKPTKSRCGLSPSFALRLRPRRMPIVAHQRS
jgi:hypothetical protein